MSKWDNEDFKTDGKTIRYCKQDLWASLELDKSLEFQPVCIGQKSQMKQLKLYN